MRIIAGTAKGRKLVAPKKGTRPMTGRARESIFSILTGRLGGARVLDLFAGTGSLGLEALSRGADRAVFVERAPQAQSALRTNIERTGLAGTLRSQDVESFLRQNVDQYDIIFVDPPYALSDADIELLLGMTESAFAPDGILILHRQERSSTVAPEFLRTIDTRRYGDAVVTMMERRHSDQGDSSR